jgi:hypothetical protein
MFTFDGYESWPKCLVHFVLPWVLRLVQRLLRQRLLPRVLLLQQVQSQELVGTLAQELALLLQCHQSCRQVH